MTIKNPAVEEVLLPVLPALIQLTILSKVPTKPIHWQYIDFTQVK